jgi:hypothetical protein
MLLHVIVKGLKYFLISPQWVEYFPSYFNYTWGNIDLIPSSSQASILKTKKIRKAFRFAFMDKCMFKDMRYYMA